MDSTEGIRRLMVAKINTVPGSREDLEARYGEVWDTAALQKNFVVEGFRAPFVIVTRKTDGVTGSLMFQHSPRFYFSFDIAR
jgi:hypothetical protein